MSLSDAFASRLSRPAGKVLDAPIRDIVHAVLREHGYASPAEIQALRDEVRDARARVDALGGQVAELRKRMDSAAAPVVAAPAADPRVGVLEGRIAELEARLAAGAAEPAPLHAQAHGSCKVDGCDGGVRSKGFCSAHYQQWRRGTLRGFVGLDGMASVDGHTVHVSDGLAGLPVRLDGRRVLVDGKAVAEVAVG